MSSRRLRNLGLDERVLEQLNRCKLSTVKDVLSFSPVELMNRGNISFSAANDVIQRASSACAPRTLTALDLFRRRRSEVPLKTSLPGLDYVLHGGIHPGSITEVTGPSGCGKTQFCIMLCAVANLNFPECSVIYIDTERTFSAQRLVEMALSRYRGPMDTSDEFLMSVASRVIVFTETTCASLLKRLESVEECIIVNKCRLLILDSIACPVRRDFDPLVRRSMVERSNWLVNIATILKYTADTFSIPIVVTNQITTHVDLGHEINNQSANQSRMDIADDILHESLVDDSGGSSYVTPALGNSWSHCVNTRLIVQYVGDGGPLRQILVAKSPVAPFTKFLYTIQAAGIVLEETEGEHYSGTDPTLQRIRVRSSAVVGLSTT